MVFSLVTFLYRTIEPEGNHPKSTLCLAPVNPHIAAKWSNFGNSRIILEIPVVFFAIDSMGFRLIGAISPFKR